MASIRKKKAGSGRAEGEWQLREYVMNVSRRFGKRH